MLDEEMQLRGFENQNVEDVMSPIKVKNSIENLEEEFVEIKKITTPLVKHEESETTRVPIAQDIS